MVISNTENMHNTPYHVSIQSSHGKKMIAWERVRATSYIRKKKTSFIRRTTFQFVICFAFLFPHLIFFFLDQMIICEWQSEGDDALKGNIT